ncbi:hypothetical protein CIPAW_09G188300 [Carya illinoinensis]|nr:hypothetical protein CIPAW_09G188300 [Carya illinoinensis]
MDVLSKAALNQGMSNYVLVVYRHVVAFAVIAPFAVFLDKKVRPKMTLPIFTKLIVLSLLGPAIDPLYFLGMKYTTATFAAAMADILPALTFVMACILSQAKVVGTIATVAGAIVITLVKGPIIELMWTKGRSGHQQQSGGANLQHSIKGSIMITIACFSCACFMILQAITLETYPAELSLTAWMCLLGTLEGTVVALVMEKGNTAVWSINWDVKLLAALYSGVICSALAYYIQGVIMKDRGPVFVTAFSPLCMVIVAFMGSFVLAEQMYLGRVLGAIIIVVGLYLVVWGKSKDYKLSSTPSIKEQTAPEKKIIINADSNGKENFNPEVVAIDVSGYGGESGNTDGQERDGQRNLISV